MATAQETAAGVGLLTGGTVFYGQYVPFIENETIEFKMHVIFCKEELPDWVTVSSKEKKKTENNKTDHITGKYSRRPISRNINAFINSGKGGVVYLGIQDDGMILGLHLSLDQKEHLRIALEDVLCRYTPPVPSNLYQMSFIPVLKRSETVSNNKWKPTIMTRSSLENYCCKSHLVRTSQSCWCVQMTKQQRSSLPLYLVQITIKCVQKKEGTIVQPLYLDEENKCYFRRSTSVWPCTCSELIRRTTEQVAQHYMSRAVSRAK